MRFKQITTDKELGQLHRLNHQTFAEELGQYQADPSGLLVDRFHTRNCYFAALEADVVVGMISFNSTPPFSIESRLTDPGLLRTFARPAEVRLLAIAPGARHGIVLAGLFWQVYQEAQRRGASHLLISGIAERAEIYCSLGFRELGPCVRAGEAHYIPMALTLADPAVRERSAQFARWWSRRIRTNPVLVLPGPVEVAGTVRRAFCSPPISHRSPAAVLAYNAVRSHLRALAGGLRVAVFPGSGTLANDIVAACLRQQLGDTPGLILANGEFGERLVRQARAAELCFRELKWRWGAAWDHQAIAGELARRAAWVWAVHLETSTGVRNDLGRLCDQAANSGAVVAADCVSSLGALPIAHSNLTLASGVSGKALSAYAGLAFVFAAEDTLRNLSSGRTPATFDIAEAVRQDEPVNTLPCPQLLALLEALRVHYPDRDGARARFAHYASLGCRVRTELRSRGFNLLAPEDRAASTICTFPLPPGLAERCLQGGFYIAHESAYLRSRSWGQISVMGELDWPTLEPLLEAMGHAEPSADLESPFVSQEPWEFVAGR